MVSRFLYSLAMLLALTLSGYGQSTWTLRGYGGLGIGVGTMIPLADYANVVGGRSGERVEDFQALFGLNGGIEIYLDEGWTLGLDYASATRTIETQPSNPGSGWTIEPTLQMPTVVVRRFFQSSTIAYGYGGGLGYFYGTVTRTPPALVVGEKFTGSGPGFMLQAVAYTYFDQDFAGMIAVDIRGSFISELKDQNGAMLRAGNGVTATLDTYSLSLRFGILFQI